MFVIGTAGHIDHGKSTLIRRLTGIDPDRLQEEKDRGLTIDLGFAWMELPSGREVGIVDVPGHHRFVRNMLAGMGSIDLTLFVVAATESWMPQSQEHLDILHILGVRRGIVVLTKVDLVEPEWLEMVREEVAEHLAGTCLADAPILEVSSTTGQGIPELLAQLDALLDESAAARDIGRPRLWIDRVFTVHGAGTVVTGTLTGGRFAIDQSAVVLPAGLAVRIRGLQSHRKDLTEVGPGNRVAVNVSGVERAELQRGEALVAAGRRATRRIHASLELLGSLGHNVKGLSRLLFYVGSAERKATVRLLGQEQLEPGGKGLVQMTLDEPVVVEIGDRFVIRDAGRQETIGGGTVLDAFPRLVRRRSLRYVRESATADQDALLQPSTLDLAALASRTDAPPKRLVELVVTERGWASLSDLALEVPLPVSELANAVEALADEQVVVKLPTYVLVQATFQHLKEQLCSLVADFHAAYPLRGGAARETIRTRLRLGERLFDEVVARLVAEEELRQQGARLALASHRVQLSGAQEEAANRIVSRLKEAGYSPPSYDELLKEGHDPELVNWLIDAGRLVKVSPDLLYEEAVLARVRELVAGRIQAQGSADVADLRDLLNTSRKYAIPLMEYFDQTHYTRRVGDKRILA